MLATPGLYCIPTCCLAATASRRTGQVFDGLAAVYLGFTVVYGSAVIRWLDQLAAQKFASTKKMEVLQRYGWSYALYEWRQWLKGVLAGGIAAFLLFAAVVYVGQPEKTAQLHEWFSYIFWMLAIWLVCWPLWYTLFPKNYNKRLW